LPKIVWRHLWTAPLHNVGYTLKQEGILQRPTIPFVHGKIFSL